MMIDEMIIIYHHLSVAHPCPPTLHPFQTSTRFLRLARECDVSDDEAAACQARCRRSYGWPSRGRSCSVRATPSSRPRAATSWCRRHGAPVDILCEAGRSLTLTLTLSPQQRPRLAAAWGSLRLRPSLGPTSWCRRHGPDADRTETDSAWVPLPPTLLIGRGWPQPGAAQSRLWRWKRPPNRQLAEV